MMLKVLLAGICIYVVSAEGEVYRADRRCGSKYLLDNGEPAQCNPDSKYPCCSASGWCGERDAHCKCLTCLDYRKPSTAYKDRREGTCASTLTESQCKEIAEKEGKEFATEDKSEFPSGCYEYHYDVLVFNKAKGSTAVCDRPKVIRCLCHSALKVTWRADRRCGSKYLLDNGEPAKCNPDSKYPCCSASGWCGVTDAHCKCLTCADHRERIRPPAPEVLYKERRWGRCPVTLDRDECEAIAINEGKPFELELSFADAPGCHKGHHWKDIIWFNKCVDEKDGCGSCYDCLCKAGATQAPDTEDHFDPDRCSLWEMDQGINGC